MRYLGAFGEPGASLTTRMTPDGIDTNDGAIGTSEFGISQLLPSGAQWAVELTNNTLWLFSGGNQTNTASTLSYSLTQPLFHGRELQAKRRAAIAAYDQASAAYRQVVLQGLQDVADVLRALEADAQKVRERAVAAENAQRLRDIVAGRYDAGGVSYYALLDAERRLQSATIDRIQAEADRYADCAALLQALGGGWWR